jgi:hypothetical protein
MAEIETNNGQTQLTDRAHLSAMDSPTKPWYLSTKAIFRIVGKATAALPNNQTDFNHAVSGVNALSKLIKSKTDAGVLTINLEKAPSLIEKLDQIRSDQFVSVSDGLDHLRGTLSLALRNLIVSISEQQKLAADFLCQKSAESQSMGESLQIYEVPSVPQLTVPQPPTALDHAVKLVQPLLDEIQTRFPEAFAAATRAVESGRQRAVSVSSAWQSYCCGLMHSVDMKVVSTSAQVLQDAQPYVRRVVEASAPVVAGAVERSQPFLQPMLGPLGARLQRVRQDLALHPSWGPYVTLMLSRAELALRLAQTYCWSGAVRVDVAAPLEAMVVPALPVPQLPAGLPPLPALDGAAAAGTPGKGGTRAPPPSPADGIAADMAGVPDLKPAAEEAASAAGRTVRDLLGSSNGRP